MTHHDALWASIYRVAQIHNQSCSGLARMCDLDSTIFNPSKRYTATNQPRWISTETLVKILVSTHISASEFADIYQSFLDSDDTLD